LLFYFLSEKKQGHGVNSGDERACPRRRDNDEYDDSGSNRAATARPRKLRRQRPVKITKTMKAMKTAKSMKTAKTVKTAKTTKL
jgi:hypothetical protein